jgi:hypothetical protein
MSTGNLFWLASYPKSGNTWTRLFIGNLLTADKPFDLHESKTGHIASSRQWLEDVTDFDIGELTADEYDVLRPEVYRWASQQLTSPSYHKAHDAYVMLSTNKALFPAEATRGVLYLIRNPLDVAVSFSFHLGQSIEQTIKQMADPNFALCSSDVKLQKQLRQILLSWSAHVTSWIDAPLPKLVMRYEDMVRDPLSCFTQIAQFLALPGQPADIEHVLSQCRIDKLQQLESQTTFSEKPMNADRFFRKGEVGDWRNHLNDAQVASIIDSHGEVMRRMGYIDASGRLLV